MAFADGRPRPVALTGSTTHVDVSKGQDTVPTVPTRNPDRVGWRSEGRSPACLGESLNRATGHVESGERQRGVRSSRRSIRPIKVTRPRPSELDSNPPDRDLHTVRHHTRPRQCPPSSRGSPGSSNRPADSWSMTTAGSVPCSAGSVNDSSPSLADRLPILAGELRCPSPAPLDVGGDAEQRSSPSRSPDDPVGVTQNLDAVGMVNMRHSRRDELDL